MFSINHGLECKNIFVKINHGLYSIFLMLLPLVVISHLSAIKKKSLGSLAPFSTTLYSKSSGVPFSLHLIRSWQDGSRPSHSIVSTSLLAIYIRVNREIISRYIIHITAQKLNSFLYFRIS